MFYIYLGANSCIPMADDQFRDPWGLPYPHNLYWTHLPRIDIKAILSISQSRLYAVDKRNTSDTKNLDCPVSKQLLANGEWSNTGPWYLIYPHNKYWNHWLGIDIKGTYRISSIVCRKTKTKQKNQIKGIEINLGTHSCSPMAISTPLGSVLSTQQIFDP